MGGGGGRPLPREVSATICGSGSLTDASLMDC
jgi:hypothetical protein